MLAIKKILFPTDFSECAAQALNHALFLGKHFGAKIHMIHAIVLHQDDPHNPAYHFPNPKELQEKLGRMAKEKMGSILEASDEHDTDLEIVLEELRGYSVANLILEYARSRDIDLIVMGTHGRRGLDYMFLGSVAQEVVRDAPCPVYTIRETESPRAPQKINRVLSPIDFSEHSGLAVSLARETAGLYDAKLQILHVIEKAAYPSFYKKETLEDEYPGANMAGLVHAEMDRFYRESKGPDVEVEFHAVEGHVAHEILEYAGRNDIDMIVIATHGLSGLKHLLLGSVAEKVINRSPCPVLTVKGFEKNLTKS